MIRGITEPFELDRISPTPIEQKHAAALYAANLDALVHRFGSLDDGPAIIVPGTEAYEGFRAAFGLTPDECTLTGCDRIKHTYFASADTVSRSDLTPVSIIRADEPTDMTSEELTWHSVGLASFEQRIGANHQPVFPDEVGRMMGALLRGRLETYD